MNLFDFSGAPDRRPREASERKIRDATTATTQRDAWAALHNPGPALRPLVVADRRVRRRLPGRRTSPSFFLRNRLAEGLGDKAAILFGERHFAYAEVAERHRARFAASSHSGRRGAREAGARRSSTTPRRFAWAFFATLHHGAVVAMGNQRCAC